MGRARARRFAAAVSVGALSAGLLAGCSGGGDDHPSGGAATSTTAAGAPRATPEEIAKAATSYEAELRSRVNDALGFATTVQNLAHDVASGATDAAGARQKGADYVTQVQRVVDAVDSLDGPAAIAPAPAIARMAAHTYGLSAAVVAATPDGAAAAAVGSALRLKLLADSAFDRARLLLRLDAGALTDRDQTLAAQPLPDFAAAGVSPSSDATPPTSVAPRTSRQARDEGTRLARDVTSAIGQSGTDAERRLRAAALGLEPATSVVGAERQYLTALQVAALVGAEATVLREVSLAGPADTAAGLARDLWNAVAPLVSVPPLG